MSYNSNYTGTQVENRLKQGYYEDIIAQGVAAGYYKEDEVPTKEELDAKLAKPELGGVIRVEES